MASTDKVKVAVRVRPFNRREMELGTKCCVDMENNQTILYNPLIGMKETSEVVPAPCSKNSKAFAFDHCFWSMADNNPKYASQEKVFNCLGRDLLTRAFEGYNACIFAYGQTGSGKSYSMMGTGEQKGIIPRLCDALFEHIGTNDDPETSYKVEVSYMEIYNEKVRDLLDPKGKHHLKVREHNILGPYVDGLSTLAVSSFEDIDVLMCEGNKSRTVAATNMNSESSRSHAVFNIILTQTLTDLQTGVSGEKVSKISLVDLAGSERAQKTGAVGERLKEGSSINKSLTTLGLVISALADQVSGKSKVKFVPYRDSVLTWLLKDNLGGNSKTVMIATLSPAADNYEETLSTLRYADRAKRIVNHAVVNEDPNARIIRELREEVDMLRKMLSEAQSLKSDDLRERLEESEKLMKEMGKTWEEKLKETERIHQERHAALEKMGISVQTSGIKVEQGRYYLVNLNADPSLNELLVYYLKERSLIGRPDASTEQDIQLLGLGIMSEHCIVTLEGSDVYLTPLEGASASRPKRHPTALTAALPPLDLDPLVTKLGPPLDYSLEDSYDLSQRLTCVNGRTITSKTKVKHGDRIVWGNNHFFRINCPKANSPSSDYVPENIDYDFAQQELMLQQMGNDPIQEAISQIEKQHEEDKQEALEKQKQMYEKQMQVLRNQLMSPSTPSIPYPFDSFSKMTPTGSGQAKYQQWARDREKLFRQSLAKLKEEVVRANKLVREANDMAREMGREIDCSVTLQIPAANLSPNRKGGAFLSEPAILVKYRGKGNQVWSVEKFENKLIEMRDIYEERKEKQLPLKDDGPPAKSDPFFETQENHILIGVANIFLEALFFDTKLEYHVPIISQQGEVAGRLHIELSRVSGKLPERLPDDVASESGNDTSASGSRPINIMEMDEESGVAIGSNIVCQVMIREARGLPPALSHFVFCQYTFWCYPEPIVVPPVVGPEAVSRKRPEDISFYFDHTREFTVHVTDEFVEHCMGGALSIEVWGHRSAAFSNRLDWEMEQVQAKSQSIMDRWGELTRKIELWVEIHELNEQGEYVPVEVVQRDEVPTGGIYQLRQGQSRRILVQVKPVQNSGTLPIICESINHISIGGVCARSKLQKGLDSYQEEDLTVLREKWSEALEKRREYLDDQLQKIMNKEEKTEADVERERSLIDQWVCLTEERNAVLVPAVGSSIPGAPADWEHPLGMEQHIPVVFLDLNADDMTTPNVKEGMQAAGINSILPKEHGAKFFTLPFVKNFEKDVSVLVSWDSSVHDSVHLNRVTPNNERVYLILKAVVQLSHPASMEIVLRKRICINVYKRQSITDKLKRRIGKADMLLATGVTYEIVSNIPKASEDLEDRESLAQIAASQNDQGMSDGETYIEKYIKGVSAVESILALDRLRQDVAIKETLAARGRPLRKATSVPNIHNILTSPQGMLDQVRSDSTQDLSFAREGDRLSVLPRHLSDNMHFRPGMTPDGQKDFAKKDNALLSSQSTIPFGIARPNFLNLRSNIYSPSGCKTGISPVPSAKHIKPMTTLIEEQAKPLLNRSQDDDFDEDEFSRLGDDSFGAVDAKTSTSTGENDEFQDFHTFQAKASMDTETTSQSSLYKGDIGTRAEDGGVSRANNESPMDALSTAKMFTPSLASSGYGSQAISTQTLSSEDSSSVQSINVDDMNDVENKLLGGSHHIKKSSTNDCLAEDENAICGSARMNRSDSLIDTDVPADLRSPMKPTTPYSEQRPKLDVQEESIICAEGDLEVIDKAGDKSQTHLMLDDNHVPSFENGVKATEAVRSTDEVKVTKDVVGEDVEIGTKDVEDAMVCKETSMNKDAVAKSVANVSLDFYSESAMTELEGISESRDGNATFSSSADVSFSTPVKNQGTGESNHCQAVVMENSNSDNSCTKKDINKAIERHHAGVTPTIDVGKSPASSGSKPRLRSGDKVSGKSAPLKATYRPVSMNLDVSGAGEERGSSCEDLNSDNDDTASMCSFGSHADLHRLGESPIPSWVQIGEPVIVLFTRGSSKTGIVQYTGTTEFAAGNWVGVELDTPDGKNDGYVKGVRYFRCRTQHGVFVRHDKLIQDKKRKNVKMAKVPTNLRRSSGNLLPMSAQKEKETSVSPASGGPNVNAHQASSSSLMKPTAASSAKHK